MIVLGFTGTQAGMTAAQKKTVRRLFKKLRPVAVAHGCCVGADADFCRVVRTLTLKNRWRCDGWGFPSTADDKTDGFAVNWSFCVRPPRRPLERNKDIAAVCTVLLACPKGYAEERRSGTWATVRYARERCKRVIVVWPDGREEELLPGRARPLGFNLKKGDR